RPARSKRRPFPDWVEYTPNSIWIFDTTHFSRAGVGALLIEDLVSRKWLGEVVSAEETHTQVEIGFTDALEAEGLLELAQARHADGRLDLATEEENRPILLAVSDIHTELVGVRPSPLVFRVERGSDFLPVERGGGRIPHR
ncbi:MAG: hypothetical protein ACRDQA_05980, partial [Nocardioidaceae bacterium]